MARNPAEAKEQLMGRLWHSSLVQEMLVRVSAEQSRPDGLNAEFGLQKNGGYRLSEAQAQRILDMRLQNLTALEQDKIRSEYRETVDKIVDLIVGLRVTEEVEREGLDINEHGEEGYIS
mgnify:CR=1 FL=1